MFAIPGIVLLIVFVYLHPQEYFTWLQRLPMLNLSVALALFGLLIDLRLRRTRPTLTPHAGWVVLFILWCIFGLLIRDPGFIPGAVMVLLVPAVLYGLIGNAVQSFRALQGIAALILAIALFLSFVGVHQGLAPRGCFPEKASGRSSWDGRHCVTYHDCENDDDAEPGVEYACAHVGLFGTYSVGDRVRFLGKLEDPNELALVVAVGLPFALAFFERKRSTARAILLAVSLVLIGTCAVFTQSRGGQLVFLAVLGSYFIKRQGLKGVVLGVVLSVPILLLGGRDTDEAEGSSIERLECWDAGMQMFRGAPILGVGQGHFTENHFLTAHNSFVLAPAELGFPGMVLWSVVLYLSVKIPWQVLRRYGRAGPGAVDDPRTKVATDWAMSLVAAWVGMLVGIFFLSFCYKEVLWIYIGLSGAFFCAVKRHDPEYQVGFGFNELLLVGAIDAVLVMVLFVYTRIKVG